MVKKRQHDGESIVLRENEHGELELIEGSIRRLRLQDGDLLIARVATDNGLKLGRVRDTLAMLLEGHKADAKLLVMPYGMDLEQIPRSMATELLRKIVEVGA